ncbi:hypothetical protein HYH03_010036 [Edaphochlamys debaryana]|uniref:N-acetyltransferase domain-containing protein n=1 Tax=Edaphochlamys debaryana TaxID=47281 RepID=A0A836BX52_9CHLO|nr:hypothetical protein HYH03_010036 [Edaphochlamys debaryana]|eukprot:KAG2491667.1 hypothetical protein HYH03_010036 [Edaphochlamys debaryana]
MGAELGLLLTAARGPEMSRGELPAQNYSYWCSQAGLLHAAKLEVALRRSVAVVAVYTTWDVYGDADDAVHRMQRSGSPPPGTSSLSHELLGLGRPGQAGPGLEEDCPLSAAAHERERQERDWERRYQGPGGSPGSKPAPPRGVPDMDWNWLRPTSSSSPSMLASASASSSPSSSAPSSRPPSPQRSGPRKSLVGFARATGDNSLVATIYDVAVHPSVRGLGIGKRMVKMLVQQVQSKGVYDIGVVTPTASERFWSRCLFEEDREGSTFMTFVGGSGRGMDVAGSAWAPRAAHELLDDSDLGHWEAAAQSDSLRALLDAKLNRIRSGAEAEESGGGARQGAGRRQAVGGAGAGAGQGEGGGRRGGAMVWARMLGLDPEPEPQPEAGAESGASDGEEDRGRNMFSQL